MEREGSVHRHSHVVIILLAGVLGALLTLVAIYGFGGHLAQPPVYAQADNSAAAAVQEAFVDVASRTLPAVCSISAEQIATAKVANPEDPSRGRLRMSPLERSQGLGSGWVYSPDGYIVTSYRVIQDSTNIKVTLYDDPKDDRKYSAKVIGSDPRTELAVIKIDAPRKLPTLALGDSDAVKVGEWAIAVGAPFGLQQSTTVGVISAKGRFIPGQNRYVRIGDVLQTDAAIDPGSSGGPVCNIAGQVVGIAAAIVAPAGSNVVSMMPGSVGIGFAIPANTARDIIPQLIKSGKVVRGWLGITIEDLTPSMREFYGAPDGGALVTGVQPGGPGAQSDLRSDDVITAIDGQRVRDTWDLQKHVGERAPGTELSLDILRGKKPVQVKLKLGEMPAKYAGVEGGKAPVSANSNAHRTGPATTARPLPPH